MALSSRTMTKGNKAAVKTGGSVDSLRVLLVDDEPVVARVLAYMVTISGHNCTLQLSARTASRLLAEKSRDFDLLITDYIMPELNGLQLLKEARAAGYKGKSILISGQLADGPISTELTRAFDHILRKPLSLEDLKAAIKKVTA